MRRSASAASKLIRPKGSSRTCQQRAGSSAANKQHLVGCWSLYLHLLRSRCVQGAARQPAAALLKSAPSGRGAPELSRRGRTSGAEAAPRLLPRRPQERHSVLIVCSTLLLQATFRAEGERLMSAQRESKSARCESSGLSTQRHRERMAQASGTAAARSQLRRRRGGAETPGALRHAARPAPQKDQRRPRMAWRRRAALESGLSLPQRGSSYVACHCLGVAEAGAAPDPLRAHTRASRRAPCPRASP